MEKKEIIDILTIGEFGGIANLWKGALMDDFYKEYEIEGLSHPQQWQDGTYHTYDGCYSMNDGVVSDNMRNAIVKYREEIDPSCNIWVCNNMYDNEQAFVIYHNGTNGAEGDALNSMRNAADTLEKIQGFTKWATLLDCYCDTCDDVYSWLFTFSMEKY